MRKNCFSRHRCYLWKKRGFNITCVLDWLKKIYQPLRSESVCLLYPVEKQLLSYHSFWYPSAFVALPREEAERASLCSCQSSNSFSVAHWKQDKQVSCRLYTSFKSTKFPYRSPSRIWLLLMTWAFTVKGISYKSSFSIIKPFLCNLKGKENQNKKILTLNIWIILNMWVTVLFPLIYFIFCLILKPIKKHNFERWKGEVARLHSLVLWVHFTYVIWWQQTETVKVSE